MYVVSAPIAYAALIYLLPWDAPNPPPPTLKWIFWGVSAALAVASATLLQRVHSNPIRQDPTTLADDAVQSQRLMVTLIVSMACLEAIGVLGLILHFWGASRAEALAPIVASFALLATGAQAQGAAPNDAQIAAIVVTANQVDIDAGRLAKSKGQSKEIKDFGQQMVTDHTGVNKSATDLVKKLKVKPEEVVEMETRLAGREMAFEAEDDDESYAPVHYLAADAAAEPLQQLEAEEEERVRAESMSKALAALDARSRRIVEARWLREKDAATLHDLAAEFGVSAERIRQIEAKAMQKMRKLLPAPSAA